MCGLILAVLIRYAAQFQVLRYINQDILIYKCFTCNTIGHLVTQNVP